MVATSNPIRQTSENRGGSILRWRGLVVIALALLALPLHAAVSFNVSFGLDGYVPEASWFPIVCEINNDGPGIDAMIEVTGGAMNQGSYTRLVPVELPTGTRKRVTIPVFCSTVSYNSTWDVRLKDAQGHTRDEQLNLRPHGTISRTTVLLGSLARSPGWAPSFQKVQPNHTDKQPLAARLQPALLPDDPLLLEGMDALYLNSERAADLRPAQVKALQTWVNCGGHLILAVEQVADVNNTEWLRGLAPIDLNGSTQVKPGTALEDWLRSRLPHSAARDNQPTGRSRPNNRQGTNLTSATMETPFADLLNDNTFDARDLLVATGSLRGAKVLVAANDTPLVVTRSLGNGRVTFLLFSPEREPAKSWRNQPAFWSRITDVPPRWYVSSESYYGGGWGLDGIFGAMVDSRQVRKLPIFWLLVMLLIYLAIIGPLDQLWLRRINKPMLTWITFPCYVALFSGLIYLVGYKLRAGESEWNELNVVDVFPAGGHAELRGRTFGSIYSPVNQNYTFESTAQAAAFRGEFSGSYSGNSGSDRGQIVQSESQFKADVFVPVWTSQLYVNDWLQPGDAPFFAKIEKSNDGWKATVQNRLDRPLTHLHLVTSAIPGIREVFDLGDLPARQTREFTQSAIRGTALADFVQRNGNNFQNAVQQRRSAFGKMEGGRIDNLPDASMAASFLAYLNPQDNYNSFVTPPTFDLSSAAERDNAILLAWVPDASPVKPMNQFSPRRKTVNTLWRLTVPLNETP